jgi:hypothetical protein
MTKEFFTKHVVERRIELIKKVLEAKGTEYGADKSAFHTFINGSKLSFHATEQAYAWELMCKHLQSIKDMIDDHQKSMISPSKEQIEEKFGDAINYLILIEGMFKENLPLDDKLKYTITSV